MTDIEIAGTKVDNGCCGRLKAALSLWVQPNREVAGEAAVRCILDNHLGTQVESEFAGIAQLLKIIEMFCNAAASQYGFADWLVKFYLPGRMDN